MIPARQAVARVPAACYRSAAMDAAPHPALTRSAKARALTGTAPAPGDKSISHRALIMGALAVGETRITGLLMGEDVLRTASAMAALGATVKRADAGNA